MLRVQFELFPFGIGFISELLLLLPSVYEPDPPLVGTVGQELVFNSCLFPG